MASAKSPSPYSQWSREDLAERILTLEHQLQELKEKNTSRLPSPEAESRKIRRKAYRQVSSSDYSTRLIALKFAYLGKRYNGFEHHANNTTPLPTIEETLWKALKKAHLIFPNDSGAGNDDSVRWDGCEYSKCGRTDRGVSAFGQVIGIRVRSNRPLPKSRAASDAPHSAKQVAGMEDHALAREHGLINDLPASALDDGLSEENTQDFDPVHDEVPYIQVLNRLLPPDIRVLAWCPAPPPQFSARFSCRERQYRYFFTQPAFTPTPGRTEPSGQAGDLETHSRSSREGWLDIHAMKDAAARFKGLHDFRNFCKIDASKQITDFRRRINVSEIRELDRYSEPAAYVSSPHFLDADLGKRGHDYSSNLIHGGPQVYMFTLHGSAFLWHQVRHMVAILFLIGQGLEAPDLVDKLLDIESAPRRPTYEMASETPLVLWDCVFMQRDDESGRNSMEWIYVGEDDTSLATTSSLRNRGKLGISGVVDDAWMLWREAKMDEILVGSLLNLAVSHGSSVSQDESSTSQKVFRGGNGARRVGRYVPVMERQTMDSPETINERYIVKNGLKSQWSLPYTGSGRRQVDSRGDHIEE